MKIKVETEKKYYCMEPELLFKQAEAYDFKQAKKVLEIDEYFTDIDSEYIKNRTCLRIRTQDEKTMEITFKGKSHDLLGQYCKMENNISCNIDEYNNFVQLFTSLGYYSYVKVEKQRIVYELKKSKYIYNIMIDKLPGIGGFVEFEIISEKEDSNKEELKVELNQFIKKFEQFNLKEANEPYRDIVANSIYTRVTKNEKINSIYINVDSEVAKYEKEFFKKYKEKISDICGQKVKWGSYKRNADIERKIVYLIEEYLDNIIFDSKDLLVAAELLKRLNYENCFITRVNEMFFTLLFKKINIQYNQVMCFKEENLNQVLKSINEENTIILNNKELKEINSTLLIIINNER